MGKTPFASWLHGNGPSHFYKFRDVNEFTKRIVIDNELYFGSAEDFNDPFDFLPTFTMEAPQASLRRYLESAVPDRPRADRRLFARERIKDPKFPEHKAQAIAIAEAELAKVRRNTGLLCLAARPDHMLLWGHYANSHRGIALRFKPQKGDGYFEAACKVTYQRERPKCNLVLNDTMTNFKLALLTKADFWSYEEEWRIVKEPGSKGPHTFSASSLDGIILGAKISKEHEDEVRGWIATSGRDVELMKAAINKENFGLEISS